MSFVSYGPPAAISVGLELHKGFHPVERLQHAWCRRLLTCCIASSANLAWAMLGKHVRHSPMHEQWRFKPQLEHTGSLLGLSTDGIIHAPGGALIAHQGAYDVVGEAVQHATPCCQHKHVAQGSSERPLQVCTNITWGQQQPPSGHFLNCSSHAGKKC